MTTLLSTVLLPDGSAKEVQFPGCRLDAGPWEPESEQHLERCLGNAETPRKQFLVNHMTSQPLTNTRWALRILARNATPLLYVLGLLCFALLFHKASQSCMSSIDLLMYWFITAPASCLLALTAFALAIFCRDSVAVRIVGSLGGAIGMVPMCIGVWAVLGPERARIVVLILSCLPTLVASTALLISQKRSCPTESSATTARS